MSFQQKFEQKGDFKAWKACQAWLDNRGYSYGSTSARAPGCGVLKGDFLIAKMHNLTKQEINQLDGIVDGNFRDGPVTLRLKHAPEVMVSRESTKQQRLDHANQLIRIIAAHGRRFFFDTRTERVAQLELNNTGRVFLIDEYTGKRIYTHFENRHWKGFNHGGTLRSLVIMMRNYICKGERIDAYYLGPENSSLRKGNIWGYPEEAIEAVRNEAGLLPIIEQEA
ncbi:TPA: hypothetical protein PXL93_001581 [Yersinia enterocolitica]|nr:hypothetical protein [Yersinia enterocolitica]HDL6899013.1 hypothetical protein [Yersinia enterocolitica]HDL7012372.1 hypothetical protein [Yersinia enterocolitica]HDL7479314.1 hypothetical protein [Yersinia enterocolitica]